MADPLTATRILTIAERLVQTRGFNGFSYADIAATLRLRKASIHHHFPTKADLGERLVARYEVAFLEALGRIDAAGGDERRRLKKYVQLYADVLADGRMCLCGMLAADFETLPPGLREAVKRFFVKNEAWVAKLLADGRASRKLAFAGPPLDKARMVVSTLEGAMLVARSFGDVGRFEIAARKLVSDLKATA
jgi:TetR/AcrR family transcriptional repressor of nem operon